VWLFLSSSCLELKEFRKRFDFRFFSNVFTRESINSAFSKIASLPTSRVEFFLSFFFIWGLAFRYACSGENSFSSFFLPCLYGPPPPGSSGSPLDHNDSLIVLYAACSLISGVLPLVLPLGPLVRPRCFLQEIILASGSLSLLGSARAKIFYCFFFLRA